MRNICVSGGFDPVHVGHLRMFQEAKKLGDFLTVIVNNDNWLRAKKGFAFMTEYDREEIILGFECVDQVMLTGHSENPTDMSVCNELEALKTQFDDMNLLQCFDHKLIFANGGDRKQDNIPEYDLCNRLGIEMVFNVGGEKLRSSSDLVKAANEKKS
jgi:cytidyltransferase-like protein